MRQETGAEEPVASGGDMAPRAHLWKAEAPRSLARVQEASQSAELSKGQAVPGLPKRCVSIRTATVRGVCTGFRRPGGGVGMGYT